MFRTRPPWFAMVCVGIWVMQLGLMAMAFHWIGSVGSSEQQWWELAVVGVSMGLGALLLVQLPRAMQWRPRLNVRPSAELMAERRRIARDLHDHLGSQLVNAMGLLDRDQPRARDIRAVLETCLLDLRLVVDSMDGAQDTLADRMARLRHRIQPVLDQRGIGMSWDVDIPPDASLPHAGSAEQLVAIAQEALSNTLQHASATEVSVCVNYLAGGGIWCMEVSDNGLGIPATAKDGSHCAGYGLAGMDRRARLAGGELQILPRERGGTCIRIILPGSGA